MRAKEFIIEGKFVDDETADVARTLPATYAIKKLPNSDFYKQYRFGVAIAAAQSAEQRKNEPAPTMSPETIWGENEIIVCYDDKTEEVINHALNIVGLKSSDKKLLSTVKSEEPISVGTTSPINSFKGYKR